MPAKFAPINPRFPHFLHGGDYNPDQWTPDVWQEDMRLLNLANCNTLTTGIFAWTHLEPEEGHYDFAWLDQIMDLLTANAAYAVLATPSGARPAWLSQRYPQVLRTLPNGAHALHGGRHNHCFTSPIYRQKTQAINRALANRYKDHPALLVWHISNEYNGECYCPLCQDAFRAWLQKKYNHDLDQLNRAWWSAFWSHTYTDWSQIEPPSPIGETSLHGLTLDWKRFTTDQTIDFYRSEIAPLRELTSQVPITTNFMGLFPGINYPKFAQEVDVVSWDNYPSWHNADDAHLAASVSFVHDQNRSMKAGKPFMLMESTPSITNWQPIPKLKRPGMHLLSSIQAVAHGADTVQYFQWRKSRGSSEKLHGAVVDHVGHEHTRVFADVAELGVLLQKLDSVIGSTVHPEVAVLLDWENRWALDDLSGLGSRERRQYDATCFAHYHSFWKRGIPVDVIAEQADFSPYRLLIAPMLYMLQPGVADRLQKFVADGGTLVTTYVTGWVDENDLCFLGGWPGGALRQVLGIWDEETDTLAPTDRNHLLMTPNNALGLDGAYELRDYCALIHAESAQVLATYESDFYAGRPALTLNPYGKGQAYYLAARASDEFLMDFYGALGKQLALSPALPVELPAGVTAQLREDGQNRFVFLMNFTPQPAQVTLGAVQGISLVSGQPVQGSVSLKEYGLEILKI